LAILACLAAPATAHAGSARVAALQVALRAHAVYGGSVDGLPGPQTTAATRRFQAARGLTADGVAGPRTRRALGALGRHPVGSRPLHPGLTGWDVAALQFALETHGFPLGTVDGGFGAHTTAAVKRLQAFAGLPADGVAGPATLRALSAPPVTAPALRMPIDATIGDPYGPRGNRFHAGVDFPAATGTRVVAAAAGRVVSAAYESGWGLNVLLDHGNGLRTRYAHLSQALVSVGTNVSAGSPVGRVGATGVATGPHLHFEVTVRGANAAPRFG